MKEGFLDFESVPLAPSWQNPTAHRWCQNLSEKQKLSGGKFLLTGQKIKHTLKKLVSKLFLPVQCLVTQNLSRAAKIFI